MWLNGRTVEESLEPNSCEVRLIQRKASHGSLLWIEWKADTGLAGGSGEDEEGATSDHYMGVLIGSRSDKLWEAKPSLRLLCGKEGSGDPKLECPGRSDTAPGICHPFRSQYPPLV